MIQHCIGNDCQILNILRYNCLNTTTSPRFESKLPPAMKRKTSAKAFTLIELLTVIAIIGILAAILIPVVGAVRENARGAQCISNMRQMGQAVYLYAADNHGFAPPGHDPDAHERATGSPTGTSVHGSFHGSLWPYLFGEEILTNDKARNSAFEPNVFQCPTTYSSYKSAPQAPANFFYRGQSTNNSNGTVYSYSWNNQALPPGNPAAAQRVNLDTLSTPTKTVAAVESFYWNSGSGGSFYNQFGTVPHNEAGNFLFYDGHVERLHRTAIPTPTDKKEIFWFGDNATN